MIQQSTLRQAIDQAIVRGATWISEDVLAALEKAQSIETNPSSKKGLDQTIRSLYLSRDRQVPACPDTGWPLFFFKIGNEALLEGGLTALKTLTQEAVAAATARGILRRPMQRPLTGYEPGNNIGENIPWITTQFVPGDEIQVTYAAKGGGSEVFGGAQSRMVAFADGLTGIRKFIIDAYTAATRAGAICPPSILGVGIGGTANISADLAKEAACLRLIGSRHPEAAFHELEVTLKDAINQLGIGTMGAGGKTSVLAVHVEYAYTHIAGISVSISSNCFVARRGTCCVHADNTLEVRENPNWFGGR